MSFFWRTITTLGVLSVSGFYLFKQYQKRKINEQLSKNEQSFLNVRAIIVNQMNEILFTCSFNDEQNQIFFDLPFKEARNQVDIHDEAFSILKVIFSGFKLLPLWVTHFQIENEACFISEQIESDTSFSIIQDDLTKYRWSYLIKMKDNKWKVKSYCPIDENLCSFLDKAENELKKLNLIIYE